MALSLNDFGKAVVAAGLLPADALKSIWNALPVDARPKNADAFAKLLIKQGTLNEFQSQELLSGLGTPLVLGDYVLLAKIGAGGMGQVFKAQHRHMKRLAAIKLLPAALTKDDAAVKRFQREVQAAAKLSHPNIVQTFDAGVQRGVWYLVMEYVEGRDLSATVKQFGPLPLKEAVNYITQAARGLAFAHGKGVVHRDIKPANLLLDNEGTVKILDMGLARFDDGPAAVAAAEAEGLTQSGQVMGTVDYMAPEQALDTRTADARADIYSLGCSLYRLLTGENVYQGETAMQKLMAHQTKPIPAISTKRPEVPSTLDAVFQRMVAKTPEERYQTMAEVGADLEVWAFPTGSIANQAGSQATSTFVLNSSSGKSHATEVEDGIKAALGNQLLRSLPDSRVAPREDTLGSSSGDRTQRGRRGQETANAGGKGPIWNNPLVLGGAGLLVVLLGVIVIVRNKDGKEVAKLEVPVGHSVEVQPTPPKETTTPRSTAVASSVPASGSTPALAKAPFDAAQATAHQAAWAKHLDTTVETVNSVGAKMILIPPGEFLMGTGDDKIDTVLKLAEELKADQATKDRIERVERPQHRVVITKPFLMGATEVTVGQFKKFSAATSYQTEAEKAATAKTYLNPGYTATDDSPACAISWNDAVAYCNWLSEQEMVTYRLPTEAEWEYACRAGTTTQFSFGDDAALLKQFSWHHSNSGDKSHPVGMKLSNGFGLQDVHGNVQEWCQDFYDEKWYEKSSSNDPVCSEPARERVLRGGSYGSALECRCADRSGHRPSIGYSSLGFRCVRGLEAPATTATVTASTPPVVTSPGSTPTPPLTKAPFDATQAKAHQAAWAKHLGTKVETVNSISAKMILIPPGEFLMGSSDGTGTDSERPQHRVVITKPFWLGASEVTVGQFKKFSTTGYQTEAEKAKESQTYVSPGYAVTDESPAAFISWNDALAYCQWLSTQDKATYRLPTEAEWEYACRAGTTTQYSFGDDGASLEQYGWYDKNAGGRSHAVGTKPSNAFGLFDMHGNLYEWCQDFWDEKWYEKSPPNDPNGPAFDSTRVIRGGFWSYPASHCRSAYRHSHDPSSRVNRLGFRLVRTFKAPSTTALVTTQPTVPVAAPGKVTNINDPAFQQWMKDVAAMSADKQLGAVSKKLMELNPGFDGKLTTDNERDPPNTINGTVRRLGLSTSSIRDLSPLRALSGLTELDCLSRSFQLTDLSPLKGLQLRSLSCPNIHQVSDLTPLIGMPLEELQVSGTKVSELSPLRGMPLTRLMIDNTLVTDLTPLEECEQLQTLVLGRIRVTPAAVAALQKVLPNCKIDWDDPSKPNTPQPAASGTK